MPCSLRLCLALLQGPNSHNPFHKAPKSTHGSFWSPQLFTGIFSRSVFILTYDKTQEWEIIASLLVSHI